MINLLFIPLYLALIFGGYLYWKSFNRKSQIEDNINTENITKTIIRNIKYYRSLNTSLPYPIPPKQFLEKIAQEIVEGVRSMGPDAIFHLQTFKYDFSSQCWEIEILVEALETDQNYQYKIFLQKDGNILSRL